VLKQVFASILLCSPILSFGAGAKTHYPEKVHQFLSNHCFSCHGNEKHKGDINYEIESKREEIIKNYRLWESAAEQIEIGEMPPKKKPQPTTEEKQVFTSWLRGVLKEAADKNANDPGQVVMRRLNRQELENTLRDLTGLGFELSDKLPSDGGGGEGFTNMGAALFTSPNHLEAYLELFEDVANKAAVLPETGLQFYDQPLGERNHASIKSEIERSLRQKYETIVSPLMPETFEELKHKEYITAAWMYKNKDVFKVKTVEECAKAFEVHPIYLSNWIRYLDSTKPKSRYLDFERVPFRALPKATSADLSQIPPEVTKTIDKIVEDRRQWYKAQRPQQDSNAYQLYWKKLKLKPEMKHITLLTTDAGDGTAGDVMIWKNPKIKKKIKQKPWWREMPLKQYTQECIAELEQKPKTPELDKYIVYLKKQVEKFGKSIHAGMKIDPNDIAIQGNDKIVFPLHGVDGWFEARSIMWTDHPELKRASAQAAMLPHAHWGDVPDLVPGFIIVYDDRGESRHGIWKEFAPMREIFGDQKFRRMFKVQDNYHKKETLPIVYYMSREQVMSMLPKSEKDFFEAMHQDYELYNKSDPSHLAWRISRAPRHKDGSPNFEAYTEKQKKDYDGVVGWTSKYRRQIESKVLQKLMSFAEQAWRRPLSDLEKKELSDKYMTELGKGVNTESASRILLQRIFLSPNFLFKVEKVQSKDEHPVTQMELATRMSYALWASKPDSLLLDIAKQGKLKDLNTYEQQVLRMLKDPKAKGLAEQFVGEWLELKEFSKYEGLDKKAYPKVTQEIKTLMEEESNQFFYNFIREDRSIMELFTADYTYLNEKLARYYGIPNIKGDHFRKVKVSQHHRGGLLGMGSMLIRTSYPLRTSPVLRGTFVLENVIGHHLPAPPDNVPELEQAAKQSDKPLTVRNMLKIHRDNENCASCHDKIDPLGFALENFGPDALFRTKDAGGPIDSSVMMKGIKPFGGLGGLKQYLKTEQDRLLKQICRKFLGYVLGREVQIGDRAVLDKMITSLKQNDLKFSAMVRTLFNSKVFQFRRGKEAAS
jgi:mono/diheme cytochrome c family protein